MRDDVLALLRAAEEPDCSDAFILANNKAEGSAPLTVKVAGRARRPRAAVFARTALGRWTARLSCRTLSRCTPGIALSSPSSRSLPLTHPRQRMRRQGVGGARHADVGSERSGARTTATAADRARADRGADRPRLLRPRGTGPATPIAPMAAAVVQPILVSMGQNEAQGAQPDGSPFAGQFAAGQTLEQNINIKGNGCYTVVGCEHRHPAARHHARRPTHAAHAADRRSAELGRRHRTRRSAARRRAAGETRRRSPARAR